MLGYSSPEQHYERVQLHMEVTRLTNVLIVWNSPKQTATPLRVTRMNRTELPVKCLEELSKKGLYIYICLSV